MVYESTTIRDPRDDSLRDPSQMVSDMPPSSQPQVDELDCDMFFEVENDVVISARGVALKKKMSPSPS